MAGGNFKEHLFPPPLPKLSKRKLKMEKRKRGRERDEIEEKINKKKSVTTLDAGKVNLMERPTPIKCEKKTFF